MPSAERISAKCKVFPAEDRFIGAYFLSSNRILKHGESGVLNKMFDCFDQAARTNCRASATTLFENLDDYISEYTVTSDLAIGNFRQTFLYFFGLCMIVGIAFLLHHLFKLAKKRPIFV